MKHYWKVPCEKVPSDTSITKVYKAKTLDKYSRLLFFSHLNGKNLSIVFKIYVTKLNGELKNQLYF